MPIYEYACPTCGHRFEEMQKISDPPITVCPTCGAGEVKKLVSATSFVLKGSGWYRDHYGLKKGGESSSGSASSSSGAPSSSGDASSSSPSPAAPAAAPSGGSSAGSGAGSSASPSTPSKGSP